MAYVPFVADIGDRVRALLQCDAANLPDSYIVTFDISGLAEKSIKNSVPNWELLSPEDTEIFNSCIVYKTALNVYPFAKTATKGIKVEQTNHHKREYESSINSISSYEKIADMLKYMLSLLNGNSEFNSTFRITNERKRYIGGNAV